MAFRLIAACLLASAAIGVGASRAAPAPVAKTIGAAPNASAIPGQSEDTSRLAQQDALVAKATALLDNHGDDGNAQEDARRMLDQVVGANPHHAQAHVEMARYHLKVGYSPGSFASKDILESADAELKLALAADVGNANAYVLLGVLREDQERYDESLAALRKAEAIGTDNPWLYINYADTYIDTGQWKQAAQSLQRLDRERARRGGLPANIEAGMANSWLAIHKHDHDPVASNGDYQRKLVADPNSAWLHGNYAYFLLGGMDDPDAAIIEANHALRLMDYPMAHRTLGLAQYVKWDQLLASYPLKAKAFRLAAEKNLPEHATALTHSATWLGSNRKLQHLVLTLHAEGLSLDARDEDGYTAVECAVTCGAPESVKWLLAHGAKPDVPDSYGMTPLLWAVERNDMKSFDLLVAHGASVNAAMGFYQRTALYEAASNGNEQMVRKLLALKAKVNLGAAANDTPLMMAAGAGSEPVVRLLLTAGADTSVRMMNGQDAADIAAFNHHDAIASLIRQHMKK